MNDSIPPQSFESNLFDFHLESIPNNLQSHHNEAPASLFSQPLQHNYSFMSDSGPQTQAHPMQFNGGYSSPQLKPQHMTGFSRKRFKTVTCKILSFLNEFYSSFVERRDQSQKFQFFDNFFLVKSFLDEKRGIFFFTTFF